MKPTTSSDHKTGVHACGRRNSDEANQLDCVTAAMPSLSYSLESSPLLSAGLCAVGGLTLLLPRPELAASCVLLLVASFLLLQHYAEDGKPAAPPAPAAVAVAPGAADGAQAVAPSADLAAVVAAASAGFAPPRRSSSSMIESKSSFESP